ncbi:MAG: MFS transporter [Steroidobacteraceae bacterium]
MHSSIVIISLVVEPMKRDLGVTDTQVSLLQGSAFALFYSVSQAVRAACGSPVAWRWIIGIGATFWAVMASLCGIAQSYWQLFVVLHGASCRRGLLMPASYSIISDYFSRERLPRAYAVLMLGAPIGTAVAFGAGGAVVSYATSVGSVTLPLLGEIKSWQLVFLITGLPGIPLGLWALATLREPQRRGTLALTGSALPWSAALGHLREHWSTYGALLTGLSITAMFGSGYMSWVAVYFMRARPDRRPVRRAVRASAWWQASPASAGSAWCDWLWRRGATDAPLRTAIHALVIALPLGIAAPLVDDWRLSFALVTALVFFLTFPQGSNVAAFTLVTPNELRGQVSAVFLLAINVCGLGFGATLVALITDYVFVDPQRVGDSLSITALMAGVPALACLVLGLGPYRRSIAQASRWTEPAAQAGH